MRPNDARYSIKAYAGRKHADPFGSLVLHTWHRTEGSRDIEIAAFRARMRRGEISSIDVIDHEAGTTEQLIA